jgi:endonuclease-8
MPEGHIVHRLARDLRELVGSQVHASSPQGRFAAAVLLDGHRLEATDACGKHLLLGFVAGVVHVHLGMQGKFLRLAPPPPPRPQVRLRLATDAVAWDLIAPATCDLLTDGAVAELVAALGPDPLRADADAEQAWEHLRRHPGPIGAALLDQSVLAGVGNVFRAEALFAIGVAPTRPAAELTRAEFDALWTTLRSMMERAVQDGRIITVEAAPGHERSELAEGDARHVYKQRRCRRCATPVEVSDVGRRPAYACPRFQV